MPPFLRRRGAFLSATRLSCLLACSLTAGAAVAPTTPPEPAAVPPPAQAFQFPQRQTLTYAVDWRVFPAGSAIVHLQADGPLERVTVSGDSRGAINLLFRVSDRFQSAFSRATGCSQSFSRQIIEGRRQIDSLQTTEQRIATYTEHNLVSHINVHRTGPVPACVTDMLSAIYYSGSQPLGPGQSFRLPVLSGVKVSDITMKVEARETIHTPTATYQTIRVQPMSDDPRLTRRGSLWVWYSDDSRHIPVQMRARLFWGTLTFRLTGIDSK